MHKESPFGYKHPPEGRMGPQTLNLPLATPRRRHYCQTAACAPLPAPECRPLAALPLGQPRPRARPAAPHWWLSVSLTVALVASRREGAFTSSVPRAPRVAGRMQANGAGLVQSRFPHTSLSVGL